MTFGACVVLCGCLRAGGAVTPTLRPSPPLPRPSKGARPVSRCGSRVSCTVSLLAVCFGVVCLPAATSAWGDDAAELRPPMSALPETLSDGTVPGALRRTAPAAHAWS